MTTGGLLPEHYAGLPEQGREAIEVPPKGTHKAMAEGHPPEGGRAERVQGQATVALRFDAISLTRPVRAHVRDQPGSIPLWVVDVREVDPPERAEPVHWRLLTTHAVTTLAQARQIAAWHRRRWIIEQVFRSLTSHGLRLEDSQAEEAASFTKLAVIALIAAVLAMQLVLARDGATEQPITDAAEPAESAVLRELNAALEGRTAKLGNPHDPSRLAWHAWIVARLGGWSGYLSRGYRPPGPKTMHHGLVQLDRIMLGWHLASRSGLV